MNRCERTFDEATCSCEEYPSLTQCVKKRSCQEYATISCCGEFPELTDDCVTLLSCSEEFKENECPCNKFSELEECKRRACKSNPNEAYCDDYSELAGCRDRCNSWPKEKCCRHENNASLHECNRVRCWNTFDLNTCPCEDFGDLPECIRKAECLEDPSVRVSRRIRVRNI